MKITLDQPVKKAHVPIISVVVIILKVLVVVFSDGDLRDAYLALIKV